MKKVLLPLLVLLFAVLTGCNDSVEDSADASGMHNKAYPDIEQVLSKEKNADVFRYQNRIYKTGVQSLEDIELEREDHVTTIKSTYQEGQPFEKDMATHLPKGTKIFSTTEEGILIAEHNNQSIRYLALIED